MLKEFYKMAYNFKQKLIYQKDLDNPDLCNEILYKWTLLMVLKYSINLKKDFKIKKFILIYGIVLLSLIHFNQSKKIMVKKYQNTIMKTCFSNKIYC